MHRLFSLLERIMLRQILLLILAFVICASALQVRYVRPKTSSPMRCPGQPCLTLYQYPDTPRIYFTIYFSDWKLGVNFICGDGVTILFENVTNLSITEVKFLFNSSYTTSVLAFRNSTQVHISSTTFEGLRKSLRSRAIYSTNYVH